MKAMIFHQPTKTVFAGIMPLFSCDSQSILKEIKKFYTTNNIDIKKMVMFTSDGAAVMLGKRNGVAKLLQNSIPHLVEQHCVAHREDLGIDIAWSTLKHLLCMTLKRWYELSILCSADPQSRSKACRLLLRHLVIA